MQSVERPGQRPLLVDLDDDDGDGIDGLLPRATRQEEVIADYRTGGLSLDAHPLEFERGWLESIGAAPIGEAVAAPEGRRVKIAGIVLTRQRPATAKGLFFLTIEDETGPANVVVYPDVWEAAPHPARRAAVLVVHGRIQRRGAVVHVLATQLEAAVPARTGPQADALARSASPLATLPRMSRDFC
jgi:error-prone DNA polymerase